MIPFAGALLGLGSTLIERLIPDKTQQAEAKAKLVEMQARGELEQLAGQLEINLKEAEHPSVFVAGWRPFVGWVCGGSLAYTYAIQPFLVFFVQVVATYSGSQPFDLSLLPELNWTHLMPVLLGLLGLGGMRSYDKKNRIDTKTIKGR